jgi:hypothetical protein
MRRRSRTCTACEHYASNTIEKPKAPNWRQDGAKQAVPPNARTSLPFIVHRRIFLATGESRVAVGNF